MNRKLIENAITLAKNDWRLQQNEWNKRQKNIIYGAQEIEKDEKAGVCAIRRSTSRFWSHQSKIYVQDISKSYASGRRDLKIIHLL